jgi:hypothetical protein
MFGRFLSVALISAVIGITHGYAQPREPTRQTLLTDIKQSIARTIGAESSTVEIHVTGRIFTVRLVNSRFNEGTSAGRENEAAAIEPIVSKEIARTPQFKDIVTIYVEYVRRGTAGGTRVVDSIEFRKDVSGAFRHHIT